eukprot:2830403-Alexandrium_andersonii.AAC.1
MRFLAMVFSVYTTWVLFLSEARWGLTHSSIMMWTHVGPALDFKVARSCRSRRSCENSWRWWSVK